MFGADRKSEDGTGSGPQTLRKATIRIHNDNGFTLLELMSVLVIMGVMLSIIIEKHDFLSHTATLTALKIGVRELNTRETLEWSKIKLSDEGWKNDQDVYSAVDKQIGRGYRWNPAPNISGGRLQYKSQTAGLKRNASTHKTMGVWH